MNGSRGAIFSAILFGLGYVVAKTLSGQLITFSAISRFIIPGVVALVVLFVSFGSAYDAFLGRATSAGAQQEILDRVTGELLQPFDYFKVKEMDGYGTGSTYQAAPALRKALDLPPGEEIRVGFESEAGRIVLELGPVGYFLWYGLRLTLIFYLGQVFLQLRRPFTQKLALSILLFSIIQIQGGLVFNPTFAIFYWFLNGFIFLLPRLEKIETMRQQNINVNAQYLAGTPYR